jgi:hypothetical protein
MHRLVYVEKQWKKVWKWRIVSLIRNSRKGLNIFILFGLGFQWEAVVYLTHSWARMIWDAATQVQIQKDPPPTATFNSDMGSFVGT